MKLWTGFTIARVGSQITVLALPLTAVLLLGAGATETGLLVFSMLERSWFYCGLYRDSIEQTKVRRRAAELLAELASG